MIGGLATSTLFTLVVLPTLYLQVHGWLERRARAHEASA
jgi:cobalt-zinc-cadmium resistance protein CzcA